MAHGATDDSEGQRTPVEEDWLAAAREMLIKGGIAAVQINAVAKRLGVTRGGFYWRFKSRQDLLDNLLQHWESTNTRAFIMTLERAGSARERYRRLTRLIINERHFDPALDTAVRQWGNVDPKVRARVRANDDRRIAAIEKMFRDADQDPDEAMIRARILYFHQVGYYALGLAETKSQRLRLLPLYNRILSGFD
ncbi:MAG: TetR/AcrR family transcriptional regulator [Alphaproteobacteria bacterium]|nr:TetR/AcrR family transcriptional regulator [Alphaproteobacteria bacterium]